MASTSRHVSVVFLLLAVLIGFLSASVSAGRPCKTLFISSYTVSLKPLHSFRYPNPNFGRRSAGFVAIVTEFGHQSSSESSSNMISDRAVFPGLEFENHVAGGGSRFATGGSGSKRISWASPVSSPSAFRPTKSAPSETVLRIS
ncbi:unnamed protein product [Linum tenue]|uniref:Uncharacterized protein n=1 Tax=Linum tenue TaxID=586396 RepID=A0AAV0I5Y9_9ROSI|nr:unnamed protein product [Linum tenue]